MVVEYMQQKISQEKKRSSSSPSRSFVGLRKNRSFFYGVILGLASVYIGLYLEKFQIDDILNLPAALIVFGGSIGATLIEVDIEKLFCRRGSLQHIIFSKKSRKDYSPIVERLIYWGQVSRTHGLLSLEKHLDAIEHPLLKEALKTIIDGNSSSEENITKIVDDYYESEERYIREAESFFQSLGGYLPTFGIFGAVIGLIQVLKNMSEPAIIGHGIAVAFVATAYGVFTANMIAIPLSVRARQQYEDLKLEISLIENGLVMIIQGVNPKIIEETLIKIQDDM